MDAKDPLNSAQEQQSSLFDDSLVASAALREITETATDADLETCEEDVKAAARQILQPAIIRAEANMIRFPMFKLGKKGLKNCNGFKVEGSSNDGGNSTELLYRITRNTDDIYPSDLARRLHQAILAKFEKGGFPYENTVTFTWRELASLARIKWHGKLPERFKAAIRGIHGLRIRSNMALKGKTKACDIATKEEISVVEPLPDREHGFLVYQDYIFQNDPLPDGTTSDVNQITLGDWFLANLNSFYYAKVDRELWLAIDDESAIASRLYEYLLHASTGNRRQFKIGYSKLCSYLPITVKTSKSQAEQQLKKALETLAHHGIIQSASWARNATNELMMIFKFGKNLRTSKTATSNLYDGIDEETIVVTELVQDETPELQLIRKFYELTSIASHRNPVQKELAFARTVIDDYSLDNALEMTSIIADELQSNNVQPKTFIASGFNGGWSAAHEALLSKKASQRKLKAAQKKKVKEAQKDREKNACYKKDKAAFLALPENEQQRIYDLRFAELSPAMQKQVRKNKSSRTLECVYYLREHPTAIEQQPT